MDRALGFVEVVGLLAILITVAIVFRTAMQLIAGKRRAQLLLGVELVVLFALLYLSAAPVLGWLGLGAYAEGAGQGIATLWWMALAFLVDAAFERFLWQGALARRGERTVPRLLTGTVTVFLYVVGVMCVMRFVYDESITAIAASSGAVAFILGYSAQSTLGDLFAGLALNLSGSIKKGDKVEIGGVFGSVHEVNWRTISVYHYRSHSLHMFPSSTLASTAFRNYSRPDEVSRFEHEIVVEFSAPPDLVIRAILAELGHTTYLLQDPAPFVHVVGPDEYGMRYRVLWFVEDSYWYFEGATEVMSAVWAALRKNGIRPGLNHFHAGAGGRFDDEAWSARNAAGTVDVEMALLRSPLFDGLDRPALAELAARAEVADYTPPQSIAQAGTPAGPLWLVVRGAVMIEMPFQGQTSERFAALELGEGQVFGLLRDGHGAAIAETAVAWHHAVVACIDEDAVAALASAHPEVGRRLDAHVAGRAAEIARHEKAHAVVVHRKRREREKKRIMASVAEEFGQLFRRGGGLKLGRGVGRKTVLEATMAATALIASADGEVEASERAEVMRTLRELDILRHLEDDGAIGVFDRYCATIAADPAAGERRALDAVAAVAAQPRLAAVVRDVCVSVSAADGEIEDAEEAMLARISDALKLEAGAETAVAV